MSRINTLITEFNYLNDNYLNDNYSRLKVYAKIHKKNEDGCLLLDSGYSQSIRCSSCAIDSTHIFNKLISKLD